MARITPANLDKMEQPGPSPGDMDDNPGSSLLTAFARFLRFGFVCGFRYSLHESPGDVRCFHFAPENRGERYIAAINRFGGIAVLLDHRAFQRQAGKDSFGTEFGPGIKQLLKRDSPKFLHRQ